MIFTDFYIQSRVHLSQILRQINIHIHSDFRIQANIHARAAVHILAYVRRQVNNYFQANVL